MKADLKLSFFSICFLCIFVGCGDDGSKSGSTASTSSSEDSDKNYKSGNCGSEVVSDYNSVVTECITPGTKCNDLKTKLLSKYPGINCDATTGYGLNKKTIKINEAAVRSL